MWLRWYFPFYYSKSIYPKEMKPYIQIKFKHKQKVLSVLFAVAPNWTQSKYPSVAAGMNKFVV